MTIIVIPRSVRITELDAKSDLLIRVLWEVKLIADLALAPRKACYWSVTAATILFTLEQLERV